MHPLLLVAGLGVPLVGYLARSVSSSKRMWRELERALDTESSFDAKPMPRRVITASSGVSFSQSTGARGPTLYAVEGPMDLRGLPFFWVCPESVSARGTQPPEVKGLLGPGLRCGTQAPRGVAGLIDEAIRERLRALPGEWRLQHHPPRGLSLEWTYHGLSWRALPSDDAVAGIRTLETFGGLGGALLTRLDGLDGVTRADGGTVLVGSARAEAVWWRGGLAIELSVTIGGDGAAEPFTIVWQGGERSGPYPDVTSPPFTDARARFDGERLRLTAPLDEPGAVPGHAAYLHRLAQNVAGGATPFR